MKLITESALFVLLCCCCCGCVTVSGRCWVECPKSQRGLFDPKCFLKDDGTSIYCGKGISNSDLAIQNISRFEHVTISVELGARVESVTIRNEIGKKLKLNSSPANYLVTRLHVLREYAFILDGFFGFFPKLKHLYLSSVDFHYFPHFSESNQLLTYIHIEDFGIRGITNENEGKNNHVRDLSQLSYLHLAPNQFMILTDQTFSGLTALTLMNIERVYIPNPAATFSPLVRLNRLSYLSSDLTDISFLKKTASLYGLKYLSFHSNLLASIQSDVFSRYRHLSILSLSFNKISRLENKCFEGLGRLVELFLHQNQLRELNATTFKGLGSLKNVDLHKNYISHLSSRMFESMPNLNHIYLNSLPLHCECNLQWMSIVNMNSMSSSRCATPPQHSGKPATDPSIYVNCTRDLSYQCFNRSNSCPTGSYCQDTLDSYTCVCEEENHHFVKPINKCVNNDLLTQCQYSSTNTPNFSTCPKCPKCPTSTVQPKLAEL